MANGKGKNTILAAILRLPGVTQYMIAESAEVSQSSVSAMLQCDENMRPKTRAKIARAVAMLVERGLQGPPAKPICEAVTPEDMTPEALDADAVVWKPQYYHAPTDEFVDLGPKMELADALATAAACTDDRAVLTRVRGPVCLEYQPAADGDGEAVEA